MLGESTGEGEGKEKILLMEEKDLNMLHIYVQRQHNETHQTLFGKGGMRI
jgi:hypothetical protein